MLPVERRFMIKELYRRGVSISDIARESGHDRKTVQSRGGAAVARAEDPQGAGPPGPLCGLSEETGG
jgi:transposase